MFILLLSKMNIDKFIMKNKNIMIVCNLMKLIIKDGLVVIFYNILIYYLCCLVKVFFIFC